MNIIAAAFYIGVAILLFNWFDEHKACTVPESHISSTPQLRSLFD